MLLLQQLLESLQLLLISLSLRVGATDGVEVAAGAAAGETELWLLTLLVVDDFLLDTVLGAKLGLLRVIDALQKGLPCDETVLVASMISAGAEAPDQLERAVVL
jgi:hypothetical protein